VTQEDDWVSTRLRDKTLKNFVLNCLNVLLEFFLFTVFNATFADLYTSSTKKMKEMSTKEIVRSVNVKVLMCSNLSSILSTFTSKNLKLARTSLKPVTTSLTLVSAKCF
jgi:hypothetical protein